MCKMSDCVACRAALTYTAYTCKFTFIFHVRVKKKHCARLSIYVRNNNFCATQSLRKTRLKTSIIICIGTSYNIILRSVSISLEIRTDHITNIYVCVPILHYKKCIILTVPTALVILHRKIRVKTFRIAFVRCSGLWI